MTNLPEWFGVNWSRHFTQVDEVVFSGHYVTEVVLSTNEDRVYCRCPSTGGKHSSQS